MRNADADGFSPYPYETVVDQDNQERISLQDKTIKAICNQLNPTLIEILPACNMNLADIIDEPGCTLSQKEFREIRQTQRKDKLIDKWRIAVIDKKLPSRFTSKDDLTMRKQYKNLRIKRGILFRCIQEEDRIIEQPVVPETYRTEILKAIHNDIGHPGKKRTLRLIRERFYWPGVGSDACEWVEKCERCIRRKSTIEKEPLVNVHSTYPLELVCIDYLTLEPSKGNSGNILVITDHYTKFAKAIPTKKQTAKTTAEALFT